jgi:hypothetical protein
MQVAKECIRAGANGDPKFRPLYQGLRDNSNEQRERLRNWRGGATERQLDELVNYARSLPNTDNSETFQEWLRKLEDQRIRRREEQRLREREAEIGQQEERERQRRLEAEERHAEIERQRQLEVARRNAIRAALEENGLRYLVYDDTAQSVRFLSSNTVVIPRSSPGKTSPDLLQILDAVKYCPSQYRPELLALASEWPQVTVGGLRHAIRILAAPVLEVRFEAGRPRLFHPQRQELLLLQELVNEPHKYRKELRKAAEWRQHTDDIWLVDLRHVKDDNQIRKLLEQLREHLERLIPVRIHIGLQDGFRQRLATPPEAGSLMLTVDESIGEVPLDGKLLLECLREYGYRNSPHGKIHVLFGDAERNKADALGDWVIRAQDQEFRGSHVIACICSVDPKQLHQFARIAIENGARSVVIATRRIDVPAYAFAAHSFTRMEPSQLAGAFTIRDVWVSCYADALRRLEACQSSPDLQTWSVEKIQEEFGRLSEFLIKDGKVRTDRVKDLLKTLQQNPALFIWVADARERRTIPRISGSDRCHPARR